MVLIPPLWGDCYISLQYHGPFSLEEFLHTFSHTTARHFRWAAVDRLLSFARTDHLQVLFELGNEPAWDAAQSNPAVPPVGAGATTTCASVASYVTALVDHAARLGLPYLIVRSKPHDFAKNCVGASTAAYARFEQVAYQAAHSADPTV